MGYSQNTGKQRTVDSAPRGEKILPAPFSLEKSFPHKTMFPHASTSTKGDKMAGVPAGRRHCGLLTRLHTGETCALCLCVCVLSLRCPDTVDNVRKACRLLVWVMVVRKGASIHVHISHREPGCWRELGSSVRARCWSECQI